MKLKEKLANETCWESYSGEHVPIRAAFIAGFEKAREMAFEVHDDCSSANGCCGRLILELGEEEIEEKPLASSQE